MKKNNRWMKWIIAESAAMQAPLPWQRGQKKRPSTLARGAQPTARPSAMAAR